MIPTKNFSSRFGERVRLLALHSTEGARDVYSLGAFFQRITHASYHGAVDDRIYESFVNYSNAAWHMRNANQESDSLALCAFAAWTRDEWLRHPMMLDLAAAWLAERAAARSIPLIHLTPQEIRDCMANRNHIGGVVMHGDYSVATKDGDHTDLGKNFPLDDVVLPKARRILATARLLKRTDNKIMLFNHRIYGIGTTPLICPVGSASGIGIDKLWISAVVDGPESGSVRYWAQSDSGGIADKMFNIKFNDGHSTRALWELPDGTTQVRVEHNFTGWGTVAFEILPKRP